jgi:putative FmdB family regulatory protein
MPLYEYQCEACHQRFEILRKFSDPELDQCTLCGKGPVRRLMSSPAIQFKGSGWYITDYSKKGKSSGESTGTSSGSDAKPAASEAASSTKTDTAASASKPAASE